MTRADQPSHAEQEKLEREIVRDKRRADALRANLKRRKAQLRARAEQNPDGRRAATKDEP